MATLGELDDDMTKAGIPDDESHNETAAKRDDDGKSNIAVGSTPLQSEKRSSEKSEEEISHLGQAAEYCFPLSIVVKIDAEKRWQRSYYGTSSKSYYETCGKTYYDTTGKQGMLCILQHDDIKWKEGNEKDKTALIKFFKDTLHFKVSEYKTYEKLEKEIRAHQDWKGVYCLLIFISAHGNEKGIMIDGKLKTSHDITRDFSNLKLESFAGIPKIFILDTCRGDKIDNTGTPLVYKKHTESSDCLVIHATTPGYMSLIAGHGSVGLQGVMKALNANWEKDHLEEILIDARREVAEIFTQIDGKQCRQTLEIQTTLLHRLKLMKC